MQERVRTRAQEEVAAARRRIARLRATGPNPFDYWVWADETTQLLETVFGRGAAETAGFADIAYALGRTIDQRGSLDSMTLGIHGEWGIRARLDRAQAYLDALLARMRD